LSTDVKNPRKYFLPFPEFSVCYLVHLFIQLKDSARLDRKVMQTSESAD
jgi:hypothetical protein